MAQQQGWSPDQALARLMEVDRSRHRFMRYFFGQSSLASDQYDLVVNTGRVPVEDVSACIIATVCSESDNASGETAEKRVLTLSREIGAGNTGFAPTLGGRLDLRVYDREFLEQEAVRLGVSQTELEKIDEQPSGVFQRLRPGSLYQRYANVLEQLMRELGERGNVLLVGRGGSRFLRDHPRAFHVRLVAAMNIRVRRVMEHRWLRQDAARELIAQTDAQRRGFYDRCFGADWADPLEYHTTVNSGRLGPTAVDLIAYAAQRYWRRGT
jgi:cytidylate kinase